MTAQQTAKTVTISAIQFRHLCKIESHPILTTAKVLVSYAGRYQTRNSLLRMGLIECVEGPWGKVYQATEKGKQVSALADKRAELGYSAPYKVQL